jgi:polyhydroxybutyrate depolymerase
MSSLRPLLTAFFCLACVVAALPANAAEQSDQTLDVAGTERRYLVHDYSDGEPAALVLVLHGGGGNGRNAAEQTGFDRIAEREGLIAVYPFGSGGLRDNALLTWNAGHCCAYAMRENVDDVAFISALIDELIANRSVDPARVFVTGLSNGGMMSHRLGRELPDKITAIAPVIASLFGDEPKTAAAQPVLIVNGADDSVVRPEGGELGLAERLGQRAAGRAADAPTLTIATGCRGGAEVRHYVIDGSGHAWPGGTSPRAAADPAIDSVDLNELIWDFFGRFPIGPVSR